MGQIDGAKHKHNPMITANYIKEVCYAETVEVPLIIHATVLALQT